MQRNVTTRTWTIGVLAVVLILAAGAGWEIGHFARQKNPLGPQASRLSSPLSVPISSLHLGDVWETDRFQWALPITNESDRTVEIKSFLTSCACASITPSSLSIAPKATVRVALVLNLTTGSDPALAKEDRAWAVAIKPVWHDGGAAEQPSWRILGRVRPVLLKDAAQIECGRQSVLGQSGLRGRIGLKLLIPLDAIDARCASPLLRARVERSATDPSEFAVEVTPASELPLGDVRSEVILTLHGTRHANLPEQRIPVYGRIVGDVQPYPETILLGNQRIVLQRAARVQSLDISAESEAS